MLTTVPQMPSEVASRPLLLTREDVAAVLQVPWPTIDNLHRTKRLPGQKVGKHLRWRPQDVHAFVDNLGRSSERSTPD